MQWLYTKKVAVGTHVSSDSDNEGEIKSGEEKQQIDGLHLARCYVLGEKLMDVAFQNAVMDAILDRAMREDLYPSSGFTRIIFQGTTKSSPARKVLVDFWTWAGNESWVAEHDDLCEDIHTDFVAALVPALLRQRAAPDPKARPWIKSPETYHVIEVRDRETETS